MRENAMWVIIIEMNMYVWIWDGSECVCGICDGTSMGHCVSIIVRKERANGGRSCGY